MVQLERGRGNASSLKRAATVGLPESLFVPASTKGIFPIPKN